MTGPADLRPLRRWLSAESEPVAVLLSCRESADPAPGRSARPEVRQVVYCLDGCLADLPPAAILEILASGAATVTGVPAHCANVNAAQSVMDDAARLAAVLCPRQPVTSVLPADVSPKASTDEQLPSRRLHRKRARPGSTVLFLDARAMPISRRRLIGAGERLPAPDPHPGVRLAAVVRELIGDAPIPAGLAAIPTGVAELAAPGCSGSGVCVRACPTDALSLTVVDLIVGNAAGPQQITLSMDPQLCTDCGLCVRLCPETAMTRIGPLDWDQNIHREQKKLWGGLVQRCPRCGSSHRGEDPLCDICAFRTSNPFGSQLPPGFTRPVSNPASQDSGPSREAAPGPLPFGP